MSGLFQLNKADWIKTLVMGFLGAALSGGLAAFQTGGFNWAAIGIGAGVAAISYLIKQLATDSTGKAFGIAATRPQPESWA